jgi:hypothetical protein
LTTNEVATEFAISAARPGFEASAATLMMSADWSTVPETLLPIVSPVGRPREDGPRVEQPLEGLEVALHGGRVLAREHGRRRLVDDLRDRPVGLRQVQRDCNHRRGRRDHDERDHASGPAKRVQASPNLDRLVRLELERAWRAETWRSYLSAFRHLAAR